MWMLCTLKAELWGKLTGAQCSETVKSRVPSIWFVWKFWNFLFTRGQKLGTRGHWVLQEHSPAYCDWSLPMTCKKYRYMDDVMWNLFSLICSTWRTVLKMFVRVQTVFWIITKQVKALEKVKQELVTMKKFFEKQETKRVLDNLRMPKQQEIFTTVKCHWLSSLHHCYKRLTVLQNVFAIILLWASEGIEKLFTETVYKR